MFAPDLCTGRRTKQLPPAAAAPTLLLASSGVELCCTLGSRAEALDATRRAGRVYLEGTARRDPDSQGQPGGPGARPAPASQGIPGLPGLAAGCGRGHPASVSGTHPEALSCCSTSGSPASARPPNGAARPCSSGARTRGRGSPAR